MTVDNGNGHDDGKGHEHVLDWRAEIEQMRHAATHYYAHQFDWRGHGPPEGFDGPKFYPPSAEWRVSARLDRAVAGTGQRVTLATSTGQLREMVVAGQIVFEGGGAQQRLTAFVTSDAEGYGVLFVPFRDATSGTETYGAGRYLELPFDEDVDEVELDFNFAFNPSCAFSPAYDCPYPPPGNRIDGAVRAGEMLPVAKPAG